MKKLAYSVIGIAGILALLILGKNILLPFIYGVVLWFLSRYFKNLLQKIPFLKKQVPHWVINTVVFVVLVAVFILIAGMISSNINALLENSALYQTNLNHVLNDLNTTFQIDLYEKFYTLTQNFNYASILSSIADMISGVLGDTIMIVLYAAFIFSEESSLKGKARKLFPNPASFERTSTILKKIDNASSDYIRLKTYVSLLTGFVGYIFLVMMDVDAAFFWAFLVFALNYIPTIGSLVATVFPAVFSLIQFGEITPFIIILVGLGTIEWFIGNVLEPKLMGSSLNLSPLVTILALIVWGEIWGITGMLLSVPITVVMVIVFSQFESTRRIAILLSENGDIDDIY